MAQRPHGERSALEKFLKSKGLGLGCHTRPSLCVHIVCLIKGAGPGKKGACLQATGQAAGECPGPLPTPRHQGQALVVGGGIGDAQGGKEESRSPAPLQVRLPGQCEAVKEVRGM